MHIPFTSQSDNFVLSDATLTTVYFHWAILQFYQRLSKIIYYFLRLNHTLNTNVRIHDLLPSVRFSACTSRAISKMSGIFKYLPDTLSQAGLSHCVLSVRDCLKEYGSRQLKGWTCDGTAVWKYETTIQCWLDVGPTTQTAAQHRANTGWMSHIFCKTYGVENCSLKQLYQRSEPSQKRRDAGTRMV